MSSGPVDAELEWEEWDSSKISFLKHMIAGSIAGLAEHISTFPVDTLKTHIQCERCGSANPLKIISCANGIIKREGFLRLWRGVSAMFAGCIPAHAAYFSIFESLKVFLGADKKGYHPVKAALCGASATFAHDMFMTPFDLIKQRMQLGYYRNSFECFKSVYATEGLLAFYLSLPTTLIMNLPYGCVMVAVNESSKTYLNPTGEFNLGVSLLSGCVSGAIAGAVTTPLDVIKTRIQTRDMTPVVISERFSNRGAITSLEASFLRNTQSKLNPATVFHTRSGFIYLSAWETFRKILSEEGVAAFGRGMLPRILVHAPSVAISWTAYEFTKSLLHNF